MLDPYSLSQAAPLHFQLPDEKSYSYIIMRMITRLFEKNAVVCTQQNGVCVCVCVCVCVIWCMMSQVWVRVQQLGFGIVYSYHMVIIALILLLRGHRPRKSGF